MEQTAKRLTDKESASGGKLRDFYLSPDRASFEMFKVEPDRWKKTVAAAAREIREGVIEKVVLARQLRLQSDKSFSPEASLYRLRERQPHSFLFAVERGEACFLGASPERLVKREESGYIPLAWREPPGGGKIRRKIRNWGKLCCLIRKTEVSTQ